MNHPEITMLRQSCVFAKRLADAVKARSGSRYHQARRINWHHRYDGDYYQREATLFTANVDVYIEGRCEQPGRVDDLERKLVGPRTISKILIKVLIHWLFLLVGRFQRKSRQRNDLTIYRKAYVDDIEIVYETNQPYVLRAVYPFPVSIRRQLRYIGYLRHCGYPWRLTGNYYSAADLWRFLCCRDMRSFQRLESRAQLRAAYVVALGQFRQAQLSDEFDLGSLDFCRALARRGVHVTNSAHGVGKYLPVHAYREFHLLTERQREYYIPIHECRYLKRTLNGRAPKVHGSEKLLDAIGDAKISLVFLSGRSSRGVGEEFLAVNETAALDRLASAFGCVRSIRLLFRPHPNYHHPVAPRGFCLLTTLESVNGRPNTIFVSFSSTCQIDPAFQGRKVLIRGDYMYPETWFDSSEEVMDIEQLVAELKRLVRGVPFDQSLSKC